MVNKKELEKQKIEAEIKEIEFKILTGKKAKLSEFLKNWTTIGIAAISIITGFYTLWENLSQRKKEYDFKLNKEIITLSEQLNSKDKYIRENAAILLSAYEKDAVPLLLKSLERFEKPESIIYSLKLIKEKEETKVILNPLIEIAKEIFEREYSFLRSEEESASDSNKKAQIAIANYIETLGELCKGKIVGNNVKIIKNECSESIELFNSLKKRIEERKPPVAVSAKDTIKEKINEACEKIKNTPCWDK